MCLQRVRIVQKIYYKYVRARESQTQFSLTPFSYPILTKIEHKNKPIQTGLFRVLSFDDKNSYNGAILKTVFCNSKKNANRLSRQYTFWTEGGGVVAAYMNF